MVYQALQFISIKSYSSVLILALPQGNMFLNFLLANCHWINTHIPYLGSLAFFLAA